MEVKNIKNITICILGIYISINILFVLYLFLSFSLEISTLFLLINIWDKTCILRVTFPLLKWLYDH